MHHTSFCTFLSRFCTTTTWKCLILRFMEDANKQRRNFISLSELGYGHLKFSIRRVRLHLTKKWEGRMAIKAERTQIHFLSHVLVTSRRWILKSLIALPDLYFHWPKWVVASAVFWARSTVCLNHLLFRSSITGHVLKVTDILAVIIICSWKYHSQVSNL